MNRRIVRLGLVAVAAAAVIAIGLSLRPASNSGAKAASVARPASSPSPSSAAAVPMGKLVYLAVAGDVYLANWDGSDPVRIANGTPPSDPPNYTYGGGVLWSPNGRYLSYGGGAIGSYMPVHIRDAQGRLVASFSVQGHDITWSPDSTRVAAWVRVGRTIGIFNVHGVRQELLTLPLGGDFTPQWSPDGASLVLQGVEIPLDGSAPKQLPASDPRSHWGFQYSPDGSQVAYLDEPSSQLKVAAADGSGARVLVPGQVGNAVWSPSGDQIAFDTSTSIGLTQIMGPSEEIGVVDVPSGKLTKLIAVGRGGVIGFSPDGRLVLFWRPDNAYGSSLWAVRTDGSRPTRLVRGTDAGAWQPRR